VVVSTTTYHASYPARETWPDALRIGTSGNLELDGYDLDRLAAERGTPLWAISRSTVERNFKGLHAAFTGRYPNCEIAYSIKAHNTAAVIRLLHNLGARIDASAEYEVQLALRAGVPANEIILNGNGKSDEALATAVELGIRQVNLDSLDEIHRLDAIAAERGQIVPCLVRIQLGYERLLELDPSFESTLRIGEGKFGCNVGSGQAMEAVEAAISANNIEFLGVSHHVGFSGYMGHYSPEQEVMHHRECTREVCSFVNETRRRFDVQSQRLDLGGGFRSGGKVLLSTPGSAGDLALHDLPEPSDYAEAIFSTVEQELEVDDMPLIQFETGGFQIANGVVMLISVSEVKNVRTSTPRRYVVVDGSMMMFVSRGMMRVGHPVLPARNPDRAAATDMPVEVVGQTCVYDSIAEDIVLPETERGDVLVLLNQGAYCETESTQFNAFPRPEVVLLDEGTATVVKRRETLEDLSARDMIPAALALADTESTT
jgi:diaminopimelate decarboxylase